ncbi:hypothetical protein LIER_23939 [Lithospermum erythrorhizon]|uniref:Gag-pol polyprotein n=1 Tax=Lithospermum erythrorhizon TaxID=34254 RepID=A0AAV3R4Z0_LITER
MEPPTSYKQVQRLTGCLTALSRFISKSGDRNLPFFRKIREDSKESFLWDEDCERAFAKLKEYLGSPKIWTSYVPRTSVKAHALADFIVECTARVPAEVRGPHAGKPEEAPRLKLYVDGASNEKGPGSGILIEGPEGEVFDILSVLEEATDWGSPIARYLVYE